MSKSMITKMREDIESRNELPAIAIDILLQEISVDAPGMWDNDEGPAGWYAVSGPFGIFAYFGEESEAFRHRLDIINRILND